MRRTAPAATVLAGFLAAVLSASAGPAAAQQQLTGELIVYRMSVAPGIDGVCGGEGEPACPAMADRLCRAFGIASAAAHVVCDAANDLVIDTRPDGPECRPGAAEAPDLYPPREIYSVVCRF